MKRRLVVALLASCMVGMGSMSSVAYAMNPNTYVDVKETDDIYKYIEKVTDQGIMGAEDSGEFESDLKMTRNDVVDALWKLAGKPVQDYGSKFDDAKANNAVTMAEDMELFEGLPEDFFQDNKFDGEKEITREEFAVILYNFADQAKKVEMGTDAAKDEATLDAYEDKDQVDDWSECRPAK